MSSKQLMTRFRVLATAAKVEGFTAIEQGGAGDNRLACFVDLRCHCGYKTTKPICIYAPEGEETPCSYRVPPSAAARYLQRTCYPKCPNHAHVVRKCEGCDQLGSVEVVRGTGEAMTPGSSVLLVSLECIGCYPLTCHPESEWTMTLTNGDKISVQYDGRDDFSGREIEVGVKFSVVG